MTYQEGLEIQEQCYKIIDKLLLDIEFTYTQLSSITENKRFRFKNAVLGTVTSAKDKILETREFIEFSVEDL